MIALAGATVQLAETEVAPGDQRAHTELAGQRQGISKLGPAASWAPGFRCIAISPRNRNPCGWILRQESVILLSSDPFSDPSQEKVMRMLWRPTLVLLLLLPTIAYAQPCQGPRPSDICETPPAAGGATESAKSAIGKPTGPSRKVSSSLRAVPSEVQQRAGGATGGRTAETDIVRMNRSGEVHVYVELKEFRPEYVAQLETLGLRVEGTLPEFRLVQGWIAASAVDIVAGLDFVKQVRPPSYGLPESVGLASTAGDGILRADLARDAFGVTGAGVKVGVISDGVDFLVESQNSGDLPFVQVLRAGTGNEGTAMLEIVHDLAPGAPLGFWGPDTSLEMVQGINALRDAGARVIVDDLSFFSEPKFQDGMVAQTVRAFAQNGRVYAGSAGNRADQHYRSFYVRLTGQNFPNGDYPAVHNYASGGADLGNTVTIPNGCSIGVILQWNNPWGAAADDFDLFIARSSDFALLAASVDEQTGTQDPIELASWTNNTGSTVTVFIAVSEFALVSPAGSLTLDYFAIPSCGNDLQYVTAAQSITGNHAVDEMFSVAAVGADNPTVAQDYSSRGPHNIFFPAFEQRLVPNITATDCVQTYTGQQGFFSNPFCGTSAAAPHVAGVAALLIEASPALDSSQIRNLLLGTALDLGPAGFDFTYGAGRIDAVNAINFSPFPPFATVAVNATSFSVGQTLVLGLTAANPPGNPTLDLYVGVLVPDGNTIVFLSSGGIGGVGALSAPASVAPLTATPPGFSFSQPNFFQFTFPGGGIPVGTYKVFAALFRNGSLGDNVIHNGDLIGLSIIDIVYSP